jgi:hypothetical protein
MDHANQPTLNPALIAPADRPAAATASIDPPPRLAELSSLIEILVLADLAIYRGVGAAYAGWAALLGAAPLLLYVGAARRRVHASQILLGAMLLLLAVRLVWCGSDVERLVGLALLPCFAFAVSGDAPYLSGVVAFTCRIPYLGARGLAAYGHALLSFGQRVSPATLIAVWLPLAIGAAFSLLFLLANPDLVTAVTETLSHLAERLQAWLLDFPLGECAFLACVGWIAVALLRGRLVERSSRRVAHAAPGPVAQLSASAGAATVAPLYLSWRNSLAVVVLLYAVYLVFELWTLWFRQFPHGFYYAGYAHEGAAWLTIALGMATAVLSVIFRGRTLDDGRVKRLQRLAWIWSAENLLLAVAVYHRLSIYVHFNGLTPLRILGFYGVTAVVVGFVLVMVKIARRYDFAWLLQRQLWALGFAIYLYALTPLDYVSLRYNVARVLAGDAAPSVQITEHPISSEGLLALFPLLEARDPVIKRGIAALIDERRDDFENQAPRSHHWTAYQLAERLFLDRARLESASIPRFADNRARRAAWTQFKQYAYQWY